MSSSLERSASASEMPAVVVKGSEPWTPACVRLAQALGELERAPGAGVGQDDGELVAAHPVGEVRAAARGPDRVGQRLQALVAGLVAVRVVDGLEVVDVEEQERQRHAGARERPAARARGLVEGAMVAQPGERVGDGHLGQALDLGRAGRVEAAAVAHDDGAEEREQQQPDGDDDRDGAVGAHLVAAQRGAAASARALAAAASR